MRCGQPASRAGNGQHDDGGGQGCGTCRHIQSHGIDGPDDPLAAHSGRGLQRQRRQLLGGVELVHIRDRTLECRDLFGRQLRTRGSELLRRDAQTVQTHAVEALGERQQRGVALVAHLGNETGNVSGHVRPGLICRAGQRREPLFRIQVLPIQDAHDLNQHFLDRQYQHGAGAGLLQTLEGFPEHILAAHGMYGDAVGVAFQRNDGG